MALVVLRVVIVFTISISEFHQVKPLWLNCQWWVAPNSLDLSPLDYHMWGQCWSLITGHKRSQNKTHCGWFGLPC